MTHAALTPLLGREFDDFLFAAIDDDRDAPLLSVVSALARLDVDPWIEAAGLARMPRERATQRLTSLIASLPRDPATSRSSGIIAARLVALLPEAAGVRARAPATSTGVAPARRTLFFIGLGVLAVLLVTYFNFAARAENQTRAPQELVIAEHPRPANDSRHFAPACSMLPFDRPCRQTPEALSTRRTTRTPSI